MSARPGAPEGVEDILTEILAELRAIRAQLGQDIVITTTDTVTFDTADITEAVRETVEESLHPGRGVVL